MARGLTTPARSSPYFLFFILLLLSFCYLFHILCVLLTWAKDRRSSKQPSMPRVLITRISELYVLSIIIFSLTQIRRNMLCVCVCECVPTFVLKLSLRLWDIGLLFRLTFMQNVAAYVAAPPPPPVQIWTRAQHDTIAIILVFKYSLQGLGGFSFFVVYRFDWLLKWFYRIRDCCSGISFFFSFSFSLFQHSGPSMLVTWELPLALFPFGSFK